MPSGLFPTVIVPTAAQGRDVDHRDRTRVGVRHVAAGAVGRDRDEGGSGATVIGLPTTVSVRASITETVLSSKLVTNVVEPSGAKASPPTFGPTAMVWTTALVAVSMTVTYRAPEFWCPTYTFVPSGLTATDAGNGSTGIVVTPRVAVSITDTDDPAPLFAT